MKTPAFIPTSRSPWSVIRYNRNSGIWDHVKTYNVRYQARGWMRQRKQDEARLGWTHHRYRIVRAWIPTR